MLCIIIIKNKIELIAYFTTSEINVHSAYCCLRTRRQKRHLSRSTFHSCSLPCDCRCLVIRGYRSRQLTSFLCGGAKTRGLSASPGKSQIPSSYVTTRRVDSFRLSLAFLLPPAFLSQGRAHMHAPPQRCSQTHTHTQTRARAIIHMH